jgi:hypothetical protein
MIDQYYGKLFHSFTVDSHEQLVKYVESHFASETIEELLKQMNEFDDLVMGNFSNTQSIMHVHTEVFKQKITEALNTSQTAIQNMTNAFSQFSLSKPKEFVPAFSKDKRQATYLSLSDSATTVIRTAGNGGYPMSLMTAPFNPINNAVTFLV